MKMIVELIRTHLFITIPSLKSIELFSYFVNIAYT